MLGPSKRQLLRTLERERDHHERVVEKLIAQICHLSGRPWETPPAAEPDPDAERKREEARDHRRRFTARPELDPDS